MQKEEVRYEENRFYQIVACYFDGGIFYNQCREIVLNFKNFKSK